MARKRTRPYNSQLRTATDEHTRLAWGERLRVMRGKRGLSQLQLAERIGCTRGAVSAWERGVTAPPLETRKLIANALNTSPGRLFPAVTNAA